MAKHFILRAKLLDFRPIIWRRFSAPADVKLERLHRSLQVLMNWHDCHLHQFSFPKSDKLYMVNPLDKNWEQGRDLPLNTLAKEGEKFLYEYDFGDSWEISVQIEKTTEEAHDKIICLSGRNNSPPEDVGGVFGYTLFYEALSNPSHPEHGYYKDWLNEVEGNGEFNPEAFDIESVNYRLLKI